MNKDLYEFLMNNNLYTHSIGKINEKQTFNKFESILKLGGLYSKDSLRKKGILVDGKVSGHIRITKDSKVSLFDPSLPTLKKRLLSPKYSLTSHFGNTDIVFLIDEEVILLDDAMKNEFDSSELTVKDYVSIDLVRGILVPDNELAIKAIDAFLTKYGVDISLYDFSGKAIKKSKNIKPSF